MACFKVPTRCFFFLSGASEQEQSMCQCVLWGWQRVRCQREGRAQLSVYRGEWWKEKEWRLICPLVFTSSSLFLSLISFQSCKPHKRSVCGSNGKTYRNHCELHRDACLTGLKIQVAHDGHCTGMSWNSYAARDENVTKQGLFCSWALYWIPCCSSAVDTCLVAMFTF